MSLTTQVDVKAKLSTLWIVVMVNIAMADIFMFMLDMAGGEFADVAEVTIVELFVFAIIQELPILMIYLARFLGYKVNRYANILVSLVTIAFVILGRSDNIVYYLFASVETLCLLFIIWLTWKWNE